MLSVSPVDAANYPKQHHGRRTVYLDSEAPLLSEASVQGPLVPLLQACGEKKEDVDHQSC